MNINDLEKKALEIRRQILSTALKAGKGHVPPAFSWVEIGVALYYGGVLKYDLQNPNWNQRDRFLLSKGHACLTQYAILADLGFFPMNELEKFAGDGSLLAGHPDHKIPGVEAVSGSLGHGLGIGAGLAMAAKLNQQDWFTFVLLGDGECDEGSIWEAAMFASHHKLNNLVMILDRNHLSGTNFTEQVVNLEPVSDKWESFGWETRTLNGNHLEEVLKVLHEAHLRKSGPPLAIIAQTIKGKGVSFMQNSPQWHHRVPKGNEITQAWNELDSAYSQYTDHNQR